MGKNFKKSEKIILSKKWNVFGCFGMLCRKNLRLSGRIFIGVHAGVERTRGKVKTVLIMRGSRITRVGADFQKKC